jgi:hypothetical protein
MAMDVVDDPIPGEDMPSVGVGLEPGAKAVGERKAGSGDGSARWAGGGDLR